MAEQRKWPADAVERRPVASLLPYARNPRLHSPAQVEAIAASISHYGWTMPVLVDEDGSIIAGHGRVLAAHKLHIAEVPTMVARGWSEEDRAAYRIADNAYTLRGAWDPDLLKLELGDLKLAGFDMSLTGFDGLELDALLADQTAGLTDPDGATEPPARPASVLGDVWVLGRHRLVCGDCTTVEAVDAALNGVKPHLMVTDPPYGVDYDPYWHVKAAAAGQIKGAGRRGTVGLVTNDDRADWAEAWSLFPGDVAYVWHASMFGGVVAEGLGASRFVVRSQIVWVKASFAIGRGNYHWQHETCWYAVRDGATGHWHGDRSQSTVWKIEKKTSDTGHGTQKPVECMKRPIENNSSPGQAVYEPFSGSGTTIIAAEMTGRSCHAIEISPAYVDVAVLRWQNFTGQSATLEATGRTFDEMAAERVAPVAA